MQQSELAHAMAQYFHQNQVDKAGKPYINHPEFVAAHVTGEDEKTVAYLHDIVEDTPVTIDTVRNMFGDTVADAVALLTHPDGEPYEHYVRRVKENPIARAVKLADLRHNSDLSRLQEVTDKERARAEKYKRAIEILEE